jgi:hypothetical protein
MCADTQQRDRIKALVEKYTPKGYSGLEGVPTGAKWLVVALFFGTMAIIIGGGVLAGVGFKAFADRFILPVFLLWFGLTIVVGLYVNVRYVGWALSGDKEVSLWHGR